MKQGKAMEELFNQTANRKDLSKEQIKALFDGVLNSDVSGSEIAAFLIGLRIKGETPSEITRIVRALKNHAVDLPQVFDDATCNYGTGGNQSCSFNISTTACFILAAGDIRMAKFGDRSVSSESGSADVLEELRISITAPPKTLSKVLGEVGVAFIFTQTMLPTMRFVGPVRQVLRIPTIMSIVGPLANPFDLETQLMGLYRAGLQEMAVQIMQKLGCKRAIIVTGPNNTDEAALYGTNTYTLLDNGKISQHQFTYQDLEVPKVEFDDIIGGNAKQNTKILLSVLQNEPSPHLETAILNAGFGFYANGKVDSLGEGVSFTRQLITDGSAPARLRQLQGVQI